MKLTVDTDFNIFKIFECGQCFRWSCDDSGVYAGVAFEHLLTIKQTGCDIVLSCSQNEFDKIWHDYFDFDRNYSLIRKQLCISEFMREATDFGKGIRILKQEPWEALCSFIISQNNNIPRIKTVTETFCQLFGKPLADGFYTFPTAQTVAHLCASDLAPLRAGYRADYIISAAKAIYYNEVDLMIKTREELKKIRGVGDKVADCVMLFGLGMLDTFPVDVWMERALAKYFPKNFDPTVFSPYAGIAQQYIYYYMRNNMTLGKYCEIACI